MTEILAIHVEMVEDLFGRDMLARVTIVDKSLYLVYDTYVKPTIQVRSYRTPFTGLRRELLTNAQDFPTVRAIVQSIVRNAVVVGQQASRDLKAFNIYHPSHMIRDVGRLLDSRLSLESLSLFASKRRVLDSLGKARFYMRLYLKFVNQSKIN